MARYTFNEVFEKKFIEICIHSKSMSEAAQQLGMNYKTVVSHAKRLNCFKTNQQGYGLKKIKPNVVPIEDIFSGAHKTFQSHKLKLRLIKEEFKRHQCESCQLEVWQKQPIPLELHHIDGNRYNNSLENLKLLCPNCHALTDNYRAKNIKNLSA
ncbi:MAG: hypothetical protein RL757_3034 [Bacteroidota bacterium]|jgi:hypothetical protein